MSNTDFILPEIDRPVWGAEAIGQIINRPEKAAFEMLERGVLPAKKVKGRWVSTPRKLLNAIGIEIAA